MATKIDKEVFATSYGHHGNKPEANCMLWMTSEAAERSWLRILLFLAALILSRRAHTSQWRTAGVKNISSFSCSLFFSPFHSLSLPPVHDTGSVPSKMLTLIPRRQSWSWLCRASALAISSGELRLAAGSQQVAYRREFADALGQNLPIEKWTGVYFRLEKSLFWFYFLK